MDNFKNLAFIFYSLNKRCDNECMIDYIINIFFKASLQMFLVVISQDLTKTFYKRLLTILSHSCRQFHQHFSRVFRTNFLPKLKLN